jgi:hypothetical protein
MKKLESLKNFQLTIEQEQSVNGGRVADTEICTQQCANQYDCATDANTDAYGTDAESDNCYNN